MKKMTCRQLNGACDKVFEAETFEEMAALSQAHAKEMMEQKDEAHLQKMQEMGEMMKDNPEKVQAWMDEKRKEFDALESS